MRTRIYKKQFWLNNEEVENLKIKSDKAGMNESEYIRKLILGYKLREKPDDRFYEVMKQLRLIGNNLNQIAKKANSLGFVDCQLYKQEVAKLDDFILDIKKHYLLPEKQ